MSLNSNSCGSSPWTTTTSICCSCARFLEPHALHAHHSHHSGGPSHVSPECFVVRLQAYVLFLFSLHVPGIDPSGLVERLAPLTAASSIVPLLVFTADATEEASYHARISDRAQLLVQAARPGRATSADLRNLPDVERRPRIDSEGARRRAWSTRSAERTRRPRPFPPRDAPAPARSPPSTATTRPRSLA